MAQRNVNESLFVRNGNVLVVNFHPSVQPAQSHPNPSARQCSLEEALCDLVKLSAFGAHNQVVARSCQDKAIDIAHAIEHTVGNLRITLDKEYTQAELVHPLHGGCHA
ncbi:hypothetical protein [Pseudodesulfovibrio tunisiensis]|uniref:hypothetical protein n=1 Tax=Pseudodesulfovibrio tunisiensis TaxID=463192 RepID=UPI001FB22A76|nr:hypothetical protein [Pseudodesulfovibrio tunisiensis]